MKLLSRYAVIAIDEYTLEELRREYRSSDVQGRTRLLKQLYSGGGYAYRPPFEIALMAVEDSNVEVRQWIARHGEGLDYREAISHPTTEGEARPKQTQQTQRKYKFPERNLEELLRIDPDPFVRACLRENPHVCSVIWSSGMRHFLGATHLERLALMRNPEMGGPNELIQKIFDPDDQTLGISLEQRKELVVAFLTNAEVVKQSRRPRADFDFPDGWDLQRRYHQHFAALWRLAAKWPKDHPRIIDLVYRYIGVSSKNEIAAAIRDADPDALWTLAENQSVSVSDLRKIQSRLIQLRVADKDTNLVADRRKEKRPVGAGYTEITRIWSEAKFWLVILLIGGVVDRVGPWLGVLPKPNRGEEFPWLWALGLFAVTWIMVSCTKAVLAGLREVQQELSQPALEHRGM